MCDKVNLDLSYKYYMNNVIIKNITKKFDGHEVVKNVSLEIKEGSLFTFLGPSGCGKTTILRAIAGFLKLDSGKIFLGEKDITNIPPEKRGVGMVFQNYALFPHMTVYENIAYGLEVQKIPKKDISKKVEEYLDLVKLNNYGDRKISELSGGEQQRVALARSLVTEPKILLLDEPLCNLDAELRIKMRHDIKALQEKLGITTIFVTHDQEEALTISHKIAIFNNGECIQVGIPNEIYSNPVNSFVANFVGETNLFRINDYYSNFKNIYLNDELNLEIEEKFSRELFVSIRPEHIKIRTKELMSKNEFKGIIENIQFNGNIIKYTVNVKGLEIIVTAINSLDNYNEFSLSDEVYIEMPKNAIKLLRD
ncbi:ABC transporter ATP-binding protein [Fusobacterium sp. MFO224]|uniref:ABC transporter ATP-binding protein n=1 Tax=Fusobacterium sp. MFO224 TaxID=3378070 RepID=UPI0038538B65